MSKSTKTMKATKVTKAVKKVKAKKVADTRKNVNAAKAAVAKVIKKQAADREAKKKLLAKKKAVKKVVAKKTKAVAKKKTAKETLKEKYTKLYKIVGNYSENLMQDVYSVVYRTKTLKRFVNENLCKAYIEQEVLLRVAEHSMKESKKTKALKAELESEFA